MAKHSHSDNFCNFCGRPESPENPLIYGLTGAICENCIRTAADLIRDAQQQKQMESKKSFQVKLLKPSEIKRRLDQYVIGQDEAKKVISVAVYNHY